jgi:NTP pyrophosphatase (non-canonical NTP hydrolase)
VAFISGRLLAVIETEMNKAEKKFGPLTSDHCRALTLLMEEFGEVSREILELRRAGADVEECNARRNRAIAELVQMVSLSVFMVQNLEREIRTCQPSLS